MPAWPPAGSVRSISWRGIVLVVSLVIIGLGCNIEKPYHLEPNIYAAPVQIFRSPGTRLFLSSRAGLFYFTTPVNVPNVSFPVTKIFYQQLLANHIFYELELIPETYSTLEEALHVGRNKKYDLVILGQVPYFLDSGTTSKSGLQVSFRVLEVHSGVTVCYLSDAIGAEPSPMLDFIMWDTLPKPSPSIYALAQILANRICRVLSPPPPQLQPNQKLNQVKEVPPPPSPFADARTK